MNTKLYTGGTFDMFHYGHVNFLKKCSMISSEVIVSLNSDEFIEEYKGAPPIMTFNERKKSLLACQYVDIVIENTGNSDSKVAIESCNPGIIAIGDDWAAKDYYSQMNFTQEWLDEKDMVLLYLPYTRGISTSEIKHRFRNINRLKNKLLITICAKDPTIELKRTIDSALSMYTNADIIVIDSDSSDTSMYDLLESDKMYNKVSILYSKNINYELGAWKIAYKNYPNYSHYMFIQDSTLPIAKLSYDNLDDLTVYTWPWQYGFKDHPELLTSGVAECLTVGTKLEQEFLKYMDIEFNIAANNSFVANNKLTNNLLSVFKTLPTCKLGSCSMERLLGLAVILLKIETKDMRPYFKKTAGGRL